MARGDHIRVNRGLYWHHGIDLGDGTVIHAAGEPGKRKFGALVRHTSMEEFVRGGRAVRVDVAESLPADEIVDRARQAVGRGGYSLLFNNCEHFAYWCQTGVLGSRQVERAAFAGTVAGLAVRVAATAVSSSGGAGLLLRAVQFANPVTTSLAVVGTAVMLASQVKRVLLSVDEPEVAMSELSLAGDQVAAERQPGNGIPWLSS